MSFKLFDYVNAKGENEIKKWTSKLEKIQRSKLKEKLDKLALYGDTLHPHMLSDTGIPGVQKLRVQGNVKLRPLLCKGPLDIEKEFTILFGAKEIGDKWSPKKAPELANDIKQEVILNINSRRIKHERVD